MEKDTLQDFIGLTDLTKDEFETAEKWHKLYNADYSQKKLVEFISAEISRCISAIAQKTDDVKSSEMYSLRAYLRLLTQIKGAIVIQEQIKKDITERIN